MNFSDNDIYRAGKKVGPRKPSRSTSQVHILPTSCKLVLLCIACSFSVCCAAAEMSNQEVFDEANQSFAEANAQALVNPSKSQDLYQKSILKYQFLIDERELSTAELHANLGNAYFSSGKQGRAVLHYQRALDVNPLQEDVRHNLRYVRSLTIDELPVPLTQRVEHALTCWHRWPFVLRSSLFGLAHAALWILIAVLFYRRKRAIYWGIASTATLSVMFGLSLLASHQRWDNPVDGVVVEREVIARQGDGLIYDNAFTSSLHAGTEFSVIEQRGEWYYAKLLNGDTCWLPVTSVELVKP